MILSDRDIKRLISSGRIKLSPKPDMNEALGAASLDLRLSSKFRVYKSTATPFIDPQDRGTFEQLTEPIDVTESDPAQALLPNAQPGPRAFVLHPGEFVLGLTEEQIELPDDVAARIEGKSSLGRLGIVIHSTAGHIDPGYIGGITLEITNIGVIPVLLHPGMRFCQLVFESMSGPVEVPYSEKKTAKYAGTTEPGSSKIFEEAGKKKVSRPAAKKGLKKVAKTKKSTRRVAHKTSAA
ncbi:dCTP deaminase [Patescibacteria group bacterium]|nr:dCTP deaminase [Patescibacteria group bacterium]